MAITFQPLQPPDTYLNQFEAAFEVPKPTGKIVYFIGGPYDLTKRVVDFHVEHMNMDTLYNDSFPRSPYDVFQVKRIVYKLIPVAFSHAENIEIWIGIPQ